MNVFITILTAILLVSPFLLGGIYLSIYNGLQTAVTRVQQGWAGIEVQLKRRHDLIPTLVSSVKSAMRHENEIFNNLIEARKQAIQAVQNGDREAIASSEALLTSALQGFQLSVEDNPEITATANIQILQKQLEETEDQIAAARRLYNGNVQNLNQRIVTFPGNFIAANHSIQQAISFEIDAKDKATIYAQPQVQLHD